MTDDPKLIEAMARRMSDRDADRDCMFDRYRWHAEAAFAAIREAGYRLVPVDLQGRPDVV